jgi:hypothetical protein
VPLEDASVQQELFEEEREEEIKVEAIRSKLETI